MFCGQCGTACQPEYKFCKNCGAAVGASANVQDAAAGSAMDDPAVQAMAPETYQNVAANVPLAVLAPGAYQTVPQPIYYVAQQAAVQAQTARQNRLLSSLRGRIQSLASTENLEGFSLKEMFSEAFKRHGAEAIEDYILVGTSKTTPPIELVETGWPKPWLFFRLLVALVIAYVALTFLYMRTGNPNCVPGMMFLGAFAVPLATLVLFFELNTPRNVSLHTVGKLFLLGAIVSLAVALLGI